MMIQILQRTPPWVVVLFVALIAFGLLQTRTRHVARVRVTVLPAVLIVMSAASVWTTFGGMPAALAGWLAGILAAVLLNRLLRWPRRVAYLPGARGYRVEGSWAPLAVMMTIFFTRYATNVALAIKPALAADAAIGGPAGLAYGLMSGAFLARALRILSAPPAEESPA